MQHNFPKDQSTEIEEGVDKKKGKGMTDLDDSAKSSSLSLLAVDVNEFFWDKLLNDVEVAEKEYSGFDLMRSFKEIIEILKEKDKRSLRSILASYPLLLRELNDILAEFQIRSTERKQVVHNLLLLKSPRDRKDQLREIRMRKIKTTLEEINMEELSTQLVPLPSIVQELTYREMPGEPVTTSELIGLDDHMKNIKDLIGNGSSKCGFKAIGIIGMGGTGKTALARSIFNDPEVSETFHPRIWLRSSHPMEKEVDKLKVMMFVFEELGYDFDELNNFSITELLECMKRLLTGQRYLIVVDEVWCTEDDWLDDLHKELEAERDANRFSRGLPKDCGGALLVTTRIPELGKRMVGGDNLYHLKPLGTEKCLEISRNYIEKFNFDEKKVSGYIEHHGFGLPLAAKVFVQIGRKLPQNVG